MGEIGDGLLLRGLEDDGLYTLPIKEHSLRKIELHNAYVSLFSRAMKNTWPQRAYVGLYSGPGRGRLAGTGEIVTTTALAALQVSDPFTKYIFVDNDPRCIEALEARIQALNRGYDVSCIEENVSEAVPEIMKVMPSYSRVLLYYLVLYSRNDLGRKFWNVARSGVDDQLGLFDDRQPSGPSNIPAGNSSDASMFSKLTRE